MMVVHERSVMCCPKCMKKGKGSKGHFFFSFNQLQTHFKGKLHRDVHDPRAKYALQVRDEDDIEMIKIVDGFRHVEQVFTLSILL